MKQDLFNYYKNALSDGLCQEYIGYWRACGQKKDKLVKLAIAQQSLPHFMTYCYKGKGLSKQFILDNFKEYINGHEESVIHDADGVHGYTYSLYVGFNGNLSVSTDVLAMMWCNSPLVHIKAAKSPILYIGNDSHIKLILDGYNCPKIYLFDNSSVELVGGDEESNVVIYKYSKNADVIINKYCLSKVKTFEKELRL